MRLRLGRLGVKIPDWCYSGVDRNSTTVLGDDLPHAFRYHGKCRTTVFEAEERVVFAGTHDHIPTGELVKIERLPSGSTWLGMKKSLGRRTGRRTKKDVFHIPRKLDKDQIQVKYLGKAYVVAQRDLHREPLAKIKVDEAVQQWMRSTGDTIEISSETALHDPSHKQHKDTLWFPVSSAEKESRDVRTPLISQVMDEKRRLRQLSRRFGQLHQEVLRASGRPAPLLAQLYRDAARENMRKRWNVAFHEWCVEAICHYYLLDPELRERWLAEPGRRSRVSVLSSDHLGPEVLPSGPLKLLDLGSCANYFAGRAHFDVTAVDLAKGPGPELPADKVKMTLLLSLKGQTNHNQPLFMN
eukprot:g4969.t1